MAIELLTPCASGQCVSRRFEPTREGTTATWRVDAWGLELAMEKYTARLVLNGSYGGHRVESEGVAVYAPIVLDVLRDAGSGSLEIVSEGVDQFVLKWPSEGLTALEHYRPRVVGDSGERTWTVTLQRNNWQATAGGRCAAGTDIAETATAAMGPAGTFAVTRSDGQPPAYTTGCDRGGSGGKKRGNSPWRMTVRGERPGVEPVERVFEQDMRHVVVQEYWDHGPYVAGNPARRINCKKSTERNEQGQIIVLVDGTGNCSGNNVWPWPTANDLVPVAAREAYTQNYPGGTAGGTGAGGSRVCEAIDGCGPLVYGNYWNATGGPLAFTGAKPLDFAEAVRATYNAFYRDLVQGPIQDQTPIITSGWRNPERNEAVGGAVNSEHQWQATLDLFLPSRDAEAGVYDPANPDIGPTYWCRLANVVWDSPARSEVIVENSKRTFEQRFMFYWSADAEIDTAPDSHDPNAGTHGLSCVDSVRRRIEECLQAHATIPYDDIELQSCSPNHVHAAR